jgi:hypothetical protein
MVCCRVHFVVVFSLTRFARDNHGLAASADA